MLLRWKHVSGIVHGSPRKMRSAHARESGGLDVFPEVFYQTMAQLCFTLLGLWWLVLQTKYREWIDSPPQRRRITNISLYFLLPGSMSLLALLAGNARLLWQIAFCVAGILGVIETIFILRGAPKRSEQPRPPHGAASPLTRLRMAMVAEWLALALFALVAIIAVVPDAGYIKALALSALTVEGILATLLVVLGLVFAWIYFLEPAHTDTPASHP